MEAYIITSVNNLQSAITICLTWPAVKILEVILSFVKLYTHIDTGAKGETYFRHVNCFIKFFQHFDVERSEDAVLISLFKYVMSHDTRNDSTQFWIEVMTN